ALVGLAVRKAAGQGNPSLGITAAALAVGALIFGKLLIHLFALQPMIEDELLGNQEAVNVAYFLDMAHRRAFSPELRAALPEVVRSDSTLLSDSVPRPLRARHGIRQQRRIRPDDFGERGPELRRERPTVRHVQEIRHVDRLLIPEQLVLDHRLEREEVNQELAEDQRANGERRGGDTE